VTFSSMSALKRHLSRLSKGEKILLFEPTSDLSSIIAIKAARIGVEPTFITTNVQASRQHPS
jgi:hypothetical protein